MKEALEPTSDEEYLQALDSFGTDSDDEFFDAVDNEDQIIKTINE